MSQSPILDKHGKPTGEYSTCVPHSIMAFREAAGVESALTDEALASPARRAAAPNGVGLPIADSPPESLPQQPAA